MKSSGGVQEEKSLMDDVNPAGVLETLAYTTVWIIISGSVIIYNKWILTVLPFPFPIALTMTHMAFNSILATICVWSGLVPVDKETVSRNIYVKGIIPVAGLFSVVLWLGNAAYLFLSVSFIQMLKALMPAFVYVVSVAFTLTTFSWGKLSNICLICAGVAIAAFGEIQFNLIGLNLQIASSLAEALRLALLQILLQKRGIKLNPISTLYYIAPPCFVFLCIPFIIIEMPKLIQQPSTPTQVVILPMHMLLNAATAFALNVCVFAFVARTSALTMNLAGVAKDWLLILMSYLIFSAPISALNLIGYGIAFLGLMVWNREKFRGLCAPAGGS